MRERSILVDQQLGLLSRHTDTLRLYTDSLKKDGSIHDEHALSKVWEPIEAFKTAVNEAADRLERLTADEVHNDRVDVAIGFFQKRLRRAVAAQAALKKLSEQIMFDAPYINEMLKQPRDSEDPEVNEALSKLFLTGDLGRLGLGAMERMLRLQVPAVVTTAETVFAALVSAIARNISLLRLQSDAVPTA